jgi:hypothetical protein
MALYNSAAYNGITGVPLAYRSHLATKEYKKSAKQVNGTRLQMVTITPVTICSPRLTDSYGTRWIGMHSPGTAWQWLMFVPVMRVRPVGMSMIFFKVLVFVMMRLMS